MVKVLDYESRDCEFESRVNLTFCVLWLIYSLIIRLLLFGPDMRFHKRLDPNEVPSVVTSHLFRHIYPIHLMYDNDHAIYLHT